MGVVQGRDLARQHNFARFESLADVGGGSGNMAIGACEACPALHATVFELESVVPITRQFISEAQLGDRINARVCDLTRQAPKERFDVAVLRSLIQVLSPEQAARAIQNVGRSMRPGGEIYVIGYVLDDERDSPWEAVAYDVAFMNIYEAGRSYTEGEYRAWLAAAGFQDIHRKLLATKSSLITARKS